MSETNTSNNDFLPKFLRGALVLYGICSLTAMAPMNLGFLVVLLAFFGMLFSPKRNTITGSWASPEFKSYRFWALTLLITCWGSLVVTKFFPYAYAGHAPEITVHGFLKIWYLLIPAILLAVYEAGSDCESFSLVTMIKPWWMATVVLFVVAVIQFFKGWPPAYPVPGDLGFFHVVLFFGHHLSTSSIIIFPAFTALAVATGYFTRKYRNKINSDQPSAEKPSSPICPYFALIVGVLGVLIIFMSYARTGWIALLLGFSILLQKYFGRQISRQQWIAGFVGVVLAVGIFSQTPMVKERISTNYGVNERFRLWQANIDFFKHRPLTGIGWLKTQEMSEFYFQQRDPENYHGYFWGHAHSNFFEMLGGTGILGLLAFLGWSYFTLRLAYRVSKRFAARAIANESSSLDFFYADFALGLFVSLILLHFNGLTNVTFWEGKVMHQQMFAVGMLLILDRIFSKD